MPWDLDAERHALSYLKMLADFHEEDGELPAQEIQAIRYRLAAQATEINGDNCRFPACSCARASCSRQGDATA